MQSIGNSFPETAPNTREHLAAYCYKILDLRLPWPKSCEDHQSPLDALWSAYADEDSFAIWQAMRGSGKTYLLSVLAWLESIFKPRCGTTILGGSLEQSQKAVKYLIDLWNVPEAPRQLLKNNAVAGRGYELKNGSWVNALAASQKSVRGPHPQKLRLDEVDEMAPNIFDAALGQPKSAFNIPDQIVASSTLHNPFGMMSDLIDNRKERGATLYRWCVEEVRAPRGFWSSEEIERRKNQITEAMWNAEYLLERPSIGSTVFDYEAVQRAWERADGEGYEKGVVAEAGVDWGHNVTVLHIIQDHKEKYTIPKSHRWNFVELTERCSAIARICKEHKITKIFTDSNPKDSNVTLNRVFRRYGLQTRIHPVAFNKYKQTGIEVLRYLLERNLLNISDKETKECFQKFHYKNISTEQIEKVDDHDVDAAIAWAASLSKILGWVSDDGQVKVYAIGGLQ